VNVTLYDIAARFIGTSEVPGSVSNPAILAMLRLDAGWPDGDEVPWCSAALNWWCWLLRLPRSKSLMARSWLDVGTPIKLEEAFPGFDVVVLWREREESVSGHVGLYAGFERGKVLLLAGNQNNMVNISGHDPARVLGVRRLPDR